MTSYYRTSFLLTGFLFIMIGSLVGQSQQTIPPRVKNITVLDPLAYPAKAIRKGFKGLVKVEIEVDSTGKYIAHNHVQAAHDLLVEEVDPFIPQLEFYAAMKDGTAIGGIAILEIRFRIIRKVPPKTEIKIRFLDPELGG